MESEFTAQPGADVPGGFSNQSRRNKEMPSTVAFAAGYRNNLLWTAGNTVKDVPAMAVNHDLPQASCSVSDETRSGGSEKGSGTNSQMARRGLRTIGS
jgi:hypothetical protein